ncbi:MAG: hypothetical protein MSA56_10170 [Clostridium sp.]|nr:hypothetical protein [Clostridium sp.]
MEERNYKLYVHISPSGKRYYGITCEKYVSRRWLNGAGYKKNEHFTNAINKYGWDNIEHIVLFDNLTKEEASLLEQCYIALYDTTNRKYGYNNSLGGEHGLASEQTKKKISENNAKYWKGRQLTEEHKKKISENNGMAKAVLMFTLDDEFVKRFDCVADANECLGKNRNSANISKCAKGINKTAYGYIWKFEE